MNTNVVRKSLLYGFGFVLFVYVFWQNAWVTDDAYITFRSIEQVFSGRGPIWNPHERVQVYTHPLWFLLLTLLRGFSPDVFMNAVAASLASCLLMLWAAAYVFRDHRKWFLWLLLLLASKSFMDYTSSGLENALSYLLLTLFFLFFVRGATVRVFVVFGFLLICRHDLLLVTLPAVAVSLWRAAARVGKVRAFGNLALGLLPFLLWSLFAVIYYGFPFPNSAYAKLQTGLPLFPQGGDSGLLYRGIVYLGGSIWFDPFLLALAGLTMLALLYARGLTRSQRAALGCGMILYVVYLATAGGDYMAGRFLTPVVLLGTLAVAGFWAETGRAYALAAVLALLAIVVSPLSPVKSTKDYTNPRPVFGWVSDERALYFPATSLHQHLGRQPDEYFRRRPQTRRWYEYGLGFRNAPERFTIHGNVGILGYTAGTAKIIIDPRGITDPLLARLPAKRGTIVGHYDRTIPEGYVTSVQLGLNRVTDPKIGNLYVDLRLVTRGPIWNWRRMKTILRLNNPFAHFGS